MAKNRCVDGLCRTAELAALLFALVLAASPAAAQTVPEAHGYYARTNSFGILGAYSWDSSHMFLGAAEQRKILNIGASYSRKLILNRILNWQYNAEFLPVALESDPLSRLVVAQTSPTATTETYDGPPLVSCAPIVNSYSYTQNGVLYSGTTSLFCHGRRWTIGEGISPIGMQWNFLPAKRIQPFLIAHGGYMYSTQAIPIDFAGSFNFTFDFGGGIEFYHSRTKSIQAEYRYHHISNHNTADENPGIDNGLVQIAYVFGR